MPPKKKSGNKKSTAPTTNLRTLLSRQNAAFMACFIAVASFRFGHDDDEEQVTVAQRKGSKREGRATRKAAHADPCVRESDDDSSSEEKGEEPAKLVPPESVLPPFQWAVASGLEFIQLAGRRFRKPLPTVPARPSYGQPIVKPFTGSDESDKRDLPFLHLKKWDRAVWEAHQEKPQPTQFNKHPMCPRQPIMIEVLHLVPLANGRIAVRTNNCAIMVFDVFGPGGHKRAPRQEYCMFYGKPNDAHCASGLAAMPDKRRLLAADQSSKSLAIINPNKAPEAAVTGHIVPLVFPPGPIVVCDDNATVVVGCRNPVQYSAAVADLASGAVIRLLASNFFYDHGVVSLSAMPGGCVHVEATSESYVFSSLRGDVKRTTITTVRSSPPSEKEPAFKAYRANWHPIQSHPTGEGKTQTIFAIARPKSDATQPHQIVAIKATDPQAEWETVAAFPFVKDQDLGQWSLVRLLDGRMMLYDESGRFHVLE